MAYTCRSMTSIPEERRTIININNNNLDQPAHNLHKYKFSSMTNLHDCECSDAVRLLGESELLVRAM